MLKRYIVSICLLGLILLLPACGNHTYHIVKSGDTLYSIGWAYGYDHKQIAAWNGIDEPFSIHTGQKIRLTPSDNKSVKSANQKVVDVSVNKQAVGKRNSTSTRAARNGKSSVVSKPTKKLAWKWPTTSKKVVQYFSESDIRKKGINIAGRNGQSINAAAAGRVVYSGTGLIGYGRLIIIKHNNKFLSAYAHNRELLVREGDQIRRGQKIATMGSSGTSRVMLHFEIRRDGLPVNPLHYLPKKG